MNNIESMILKNLCTGLGEGNTNVEKLVNRLSENFPDMELKDLKKEIIENLRRLVATGQLQIITTGWDIGYEFFYICSKRL